jgi:dolichol-phosphate mannosyltransferase
LLDLGAPRGIRAESGGLSDWSRPRSRLSVVLPTLNERENLVWLLPELLSGLPTLAELIVVDDSSRDGTAELVATFAARDSRVKMLERRAPASLAASLRDGIALCSGELIGWMDADGAIAAEDFQRLVGAVEGGADLAIASRFVPGGWIKGQRSDGILGRAQALGNLRNSPESRAAVAASMLLNLALIPLLTGEGAHDYTSGIVVARRSAFDGLEIFGQHGEYFIRLIVAARRAGLAVVEVGYRIRPRRFGQSKTADSTWRLVRHGVRYLGAAIRARRK